MNEERGTKACALRATSGSPRHIHLPTPKISCTPSLVKADHFRSAYAPVRQVQGGRTGCKGEEDAGGGRGARKMDWRCNRGGMEEGAR